MESTSNIFDIFSIQVDRLKRNQQSLEDLYKKFEFIKNKHQKVIESEETEISEEEGNVG